MRFDPASIVWNPTRYPGIFVNVLFSDAAHGDAAVLIRMDPGCSYPAHRHVGEEDVLVLQGGYRDATGEYHAVSFHRHPAGSVHHATALQGSEPCILFAVAHRGIELMQ